MIDITPLTLGALQTNCYLVADPKTGDAVIIDPAADGGYISEQILERQLQPQAILLTHGHFDHVLGLLELSLNFPVPIYLHPSDTFLIKGAVGSAQHWLHQTVDPVPLPTHELQDDQELVFGSLQFQVLHTPGHTPGSVCFYDAGSGVLLSGDTLFKGTVGRTDFRYSERADLEKSLAGLLELPGETQVYPGHGEITSIRKEKH